MADLSITYTALRGVVPGHVVGQVYTLDLDLSLHIPYDKIDGKQVIKGKVASSNLTNIVTYHQVATGRLSETEKQLVRELILSCSDSENFTFSLFDGPNETGILILDKDLKPTQVSPLKYRYAFEFMAVN